MVVVTAIASFAVGRSLAAQPAAPAEPVACSTATATASPSTVPTPTAGSSAHPTAPGSPPAPPISGGVFFDDFAYHAVTDAAFRQAWSVRTERGAPGEDGAAWSAGTVGFSGTGGAAVMTLAASTDGTAHGTTQSEVDSQRAGFFEGTYATRIRFTDSSTGTNGAHVNETYFVISNTGDRSPNYSEMDFEYLPIGGWGDNRTQLDFTSWHSASDSREGALNASLAGWHTLVMTVGQGSVTYYVDGVRQFATSGAYYPRSPMVMAFNEWFVDGGLGAVGGTRSYTQQVDWTYYVAGKVLTPTQAQAQVDAQRAAGHTFVDGTT
jgi:hypothetical protein